MEPIHTLFDPTSPAWLNQRGGKTLSRHRTKQAALEKGRALATAAGAEHVIHRRDGSVSDTKTYTRGPTSRGRRGRASKVAEPKSLYAARLRSARRAFPSDAQVAEALGVNRAQVKRWREGRTEPAAENADRVVALDAAVELLSGYLEPRSIPKWLTGVNAHLGERRPVDVLRQGDFAAVVAAIQALKSGSYA